MLSSQDVCPRQVSVNRQSFVYQLAGAFFLKALIPYYMKFWRHFNLAIFRKIAKLKCTKIKCR